MGQMTYGIMFGVAMKDAPKELGEEGWYELIECYGRRENATRKDIDNDYGDRDRVTWIGAWCAVGASGKNGVPYLRSVRLDEIDASKAKEAWVRFATWCAEPHCGGKGKRAWATPAIIFPEPHLYLVETEVA